MGDDCNLCRSYGSGGVVVEDNKEQKCSRRVLTCPLMTQLHQGVGPRISLLHGSRSSSGSPAGGMPMSAIVI